MKTPLTRLLTGLLLLWSTLSFGQDASFSQFYASRMYLNPAFTGLEPGLCFNVASRLQWYKVDRGFRTVFASAELQEPFIRSGFGLTLLQSTEGLFNFSTTSVGLAYSYTITTPNHNVHFGLQARYFQRQVDYTQTVFSDQLDPVFGNIYPTGFVPVAETVGSPDFDAGVVWRFDGQKRSSRGSIRQNRYVLGASINHLMGFFPSSRFSESLLGNEELGLTPRITLHGGMMIPTTFLQGAGNEVTISPNFKYDLQGGIGDSGPLQVLTIGSYFLYRGVYLGAYYQNGPVVFDLDNTNAVILSAGFYTRTSGNRNDPPNLLIGFSVDINTTGLGPTAGNVYELVARYCFSDVAPIFGRQRGTSTRQILDCKNFY
jgi:type IX secretion system PorP/SprF family membrane protein